MIFHRRAMHYLIFTPTEAALAFCVLLHFRNMAILSAIDPVDIDVLIKKPSH